MSERGKAITFVFVDNVVAHDKSLQLLTRWPAERARRGGKQGEILRLARRLLAAASGPGGNRKPSTRHFKGNSKHFLEKITNQIKVRSKFRIVLSGFNG